MLLALSLMAQNAAASWIWLKMAAQWRTPHSLPLHAGKARLTGCVTFVDVRAIFSIGAVIAAAGLQFP